EGGNDDCGRDRAQWGGTIGEVGHPPPAHPSIDKRMDFGRVVGHVVERGEYPGEIAGPKWVPSFSHEMTPRLARKVAQFITVCSASNLAEARCISYPW